MGGQYSPEANRPNIFHHRACFLLMAARGAQRVVSRPGAFTLSGPHALQSPWNIIAAPQVQRGCRLISPNYLLHPCLSVKIIAGCWCWNNFKSLNADKLTFFFYLISSHLFLTSSLECSGSFLIHMSLIVSIWSILYITAWLIFLKHFLYQPLLEHTHTHTNTYDLISTLTHTHSGSFPWILFTF